MNLKKILQKSWNVANALFAIASGILTDLFYDLITEAHIEGELDGNKIKLEFIDSYPLWIQLIFVFITFLIIWFLLSFILPLIYNCIYSSIPHNIPTISANEAYSVYCNCKEELEDLYNKITNNTNTELSAVYFTKTCMIFQKIKKVFCSKKEINHKIVKKTFRKNNSINIIDTHISDYEYNAILKLLSEMLTTTYDNIVTKTDLLNSDYKKVSEQIGKMHVNE